MTVTIFHSNDVQPPNGLDVGEPVLDQPPDRFRARWLGIRLTGNPGLDSSHHMLGHSHRQRRVFSGRRSAARSFLRLGY